MILNRNPVASALSMVGAFVGMAALFIGLHAYLVGIMQILVYAGAIMVLFIFIIMLLDLQPGKPRSLKAASVAAGCVIPVLLLMQVFGVLEQSGWERFEELDLQTAAETRSGKIEESLKEGKLPDTHLIGRTLFGTPETPGYNLPLQIIGVLLLVATVGVVVLSKKGGTESSTTKNESA